MRDVVVHVDPENDEASQPSINLPDRQSLQQLLEKRWKHLPHFQDIKKMNLHYLSGSLTIELFLATPLLAKDLLNDYQKALADLPYISRIEIYHAQ